MENMQQDDRHMEGLFEARSLEYRQLLGRYREGKTPLTAREVNKVTSWTEALAVHTFRNPAFTILTPEIRRAVLDDFATLFGEAEKADKRIGTALSRAAAQKKTPEPVTPPSPPQQPSVFPEAQPGLATDVKETFRTAGQEIVAAGKEITALGREIGGAFKSLLKKTLG